MSLALLLPACLFTLPPAPRAFCGRFPGALGACLAQMQSKQEVLECMFPRGSLQPVEFGGRSYGFPISAGMALRFTPGQTEPRGPWQDLLIKAPGTSYLPIPTLGLPGGSQMKPCFSPNPKRSLAHTFILSGNFPNSVVSFDHPPHEASASYLCCGEV